MATTSHPPSPKNSGNANHHAEQDVSEGAPASVPTEKPPSDNLAATSEKLFVPEPLSTIRLIPLILGVCLGLFLSMLDSSIVATSLFTIAAEFGSDGTDVGGINWVALAYTLSYLGCAVLFARVSDVIGRRVTFAAAYVIFIAFSVGCGFATNLDELIALRALQGMGGSGLYSVAMIILSEATPERARPHISGVIGFVVTISGVLGPVLGGILTEFTSWRWVFWINGPVGIFSLIVFIFSWPDKKYLPSMERRSWKDVDFVSAFLLIAAAVLIVFPFQNTAQSPDWVSPVFLAPLLAGLLALVLLFGWQHLLLAYWRRRVQKNSHKTDPNKPLHEPAMALPPVLLRNRVYGAAVLHIMLTGFPFLLCIYVFPTRFQVVYGRSALQAGLMLLPMLVSAACGTIVSGAINGRKGKPQRIFEMMLAACAFMLLGCGLEITAGYGSDIEPKVLGFLVFIGLGFGLSASASTVVATVEVPVWEHATAQGIVAQVRIFGGSIGIAASSAILAIKMRSDLAGTAAGSLGSDALARLAADPSSLPAEQWDAIRRVYTDALREDMIVCCAVLAAAMLVTLGVYRRNRVPMRQMMQQRYREEAERRRGADSVASEAGGDGQQEKREEEA